MSNTKTFYCEDCECEKSITEQSDVEPRVCNDCYNDHSICDYCGDHMQWCHCCRVWSSNCCIEYSICECY